MVDRGIKKAAAQTGSGYRYLFDKLEFVYIFVIVFISIIISFITSDILSLNNPANNLFRLWSKRLGRI